LFQKMGTNIKKLVSTGFLHVFGSSILNKVIAFVASVVVVRILTKAEYGLFTYAWNTYSMVALLNGFGMASAIVQLCSETNNNSAVSESIYSFCIKTGQKFNILLACVIACCALFIPLRIPEAKYLLLMLSVFPFLAFFYDGTLCYIRSKKNNILYSKITLLNTFLLFVSTSLLVMVFKEYGMVLGYILSYVISIAFSRRSISGVSQIKSLDMANKRNALKIGGVSMINNGLSELLYLLDVFVIGIIISDESVIAAYKVATQIPSALMFIPTTLVIFIYPYFAEKRNDRKWCLQNYKTVLKIMGAFNFAITAFLFALAPFIITVIYGASYMDSLVPFRILIVNYFFAGTFRIISGNLLVTQQKLKFNLFVTIVCSTTNIIADYFLIKHWGSCGAAVATLIVVVLSSVLSTSYLVHCLKKDAE